MHTETMINYICVIILFLSSERGERRYYCTEHYAGKKSAHSESKEADNAAGYSNTEQFRALQITVIPFLI